MYCVLKERPTNGGGMTQVTTLCPCWCNHYNQDQGSKDQEVKMNSQGDAICKFTNSGNRRTAPAPAVQIRIWDRKRMWWESIASDSLLPRAKAPVRTRAAIQWTFLIPGGQMHNSAERLHKTLLTISSNCSTMWTRPGLILRILKVFGHLDSAVALYEGKDWMMKRKGIYGSCRKNKIN